MIADVSTAANVESLAVRHAGGRRYMTDLLTVILGNRFAAVNSFVGNNMELPVIRLRRKARCSIEAAQHRKNNKHGQFFH